MHRSSIAVAFVVALGLGPAAELHAQAKPPTVIESALPLDGGGAMRYAIALSPLRFSTTAGVLGSIPAQQPHVSVPGGLTVLLTCRLLRRWRGARARGWFCRAG